MQQIRQYVHSKQGHSGSANKGHSILKGAEPSVQCCKAGLA